MAQARQQSEWMQTLSLHAAIANLFATKGKAIDIRPMLPPHLLADEKPAREPSEEEIRQNWQLLQNRVRARSERKLGT